MTTMALFRFGPIAALRPLVLEHNLDPSLTSHIRTKTFFADSAPAVR